MSNDIPTQSDLRKTARRVLPNRRPCQTFDLRHGSQNFQVSIGYDHNEPIEVFISGAKVGSDLEAAARDGAILLSLAIQHSIPLDRMSHSLTRESSGAPSTIVGAVIDLLAREAEKQTGGA